MPQRARPGTAARELAKPQISGAKEENSQKAESFRLTEASRLMEGCPGPDYCLVPEDRNK